MRFKIPSVHLMVAAPGSGKSHLIKYLIYTLAHSRQVDYFVVFCGTTFNEGYDFLPKNYVYSSYDEETLAYYLQQQINNRKTIGIVFDDCVGFEQSLRNSPVLNKLITEHRHYRALVFIATQYLYKLPPVIRESCAYYWIFTQRTKRSIEALYETVGANSHDSLNDFKHFLEHYTPKYTCLFVDRYQDKDRMYESFRAPAHIPRFFINY